MNWGLFSMDPVARAVAGAPAMQCHGCGSRAVIVPETWAGKFHSTCCHAACQGCLGRQIDGELDRCQREGQLRVPCGFPGCRKMLPQTLVLNVSRCAQGLALLIDK